MAYEITIPRLGWSMEEGVFGEWLKSDSQLVAAGEMVFLLEGEKAAHEIESLETGYLHIPLNGPRPGDTVKVGQVIGFLLQPGEAPPSPTVAGSKPVSMDRSDPTLTDSVPAPIRQATVSPPVSHGKDLGKDLSHRRVAGPAARRLARELRLDLNSVETPDPTGRILSEDIRRAFEVGKNPSNTSAQPSVSTPRARRRAKELGVDWRRMRGTGRGGRVRERDVVAGISATPAPAELVEPTPCSSGKHVPATKLRLAVAQRMQAAVTLAAPVTITLKVDAGPLVNYRQTLQKQPSETKTPSYNDIMIWLVARALRDQPEMNACWFRNGIHHYDSIHIANAVDTPSGLLAPVLRNADQLTLFQIATETRQQIATARAGRLVQSDLEGGTFTITNLGMFGVESFTPLLNLPQAGILGIGRISEEPIIRSGSVVAGFTLTLSLTFDHRVLDGAPAARWLQSLSDSIRNLNMET
jgi:pyruvate dehydrogenase E2 component (dihydrolipoamide acetyltransferase)